jgi:hypothetical protein
MSGTPPNARAALTLAWPWPGTGTQRSRITETTYAFFRSAGTWTSMSVSERWLDAAPDSACSAVAPRLSLPTRRTLIGVLPLAAGEALGLVDSSGNASAILCVLVSKLPATPARYTTATTAASRTTASAESTTMGVLRPFLRRGLRATGSPAPSAVALGSVAPGAAAGRAWLCPASVTAGVLTVVASVCG